MKRLIAIAATFALTGCGSSPKAWSRDEIIDIADDSIDASGLEARISALEERQGQLEARQPAPSRPHPSGPTFSLVIGQNDSGHVYGSAESCDAARAAVLRQFKEQCQASGAVACADARVICVPN